MSIEYRMSPHHYLHICNEECMCDLYESITDVVGGILSTKVPVEAELSYLSPLYEVIQCTTLREANSWK